MELINLSDSQNFELVCPAEPDWDAARREVDVTKPEAIADVLSMLHKASGRDYEGIRAYVASDQPDKGVLVTREAGRLAISMSLDYFMARHYQEGAEVIDIEVDPSEWAKEKPSDWLRFPDACALALLRYDALQAAGFSVGETG